MARDVAEVDCCSTLFPEIMLDQKLTGFKSTVFNKKATKNRRIFKGLIFQLYDFFPIYN